MKHNSRFLICIIAVGCMAVTCKKDAATTVAPPPPVDTSLVNLSHLNHLYTPVTFPDGTAAAGVYIYSQYPNFTPVEASGEGFTCVDDVSRATLVYLRSGQYVTDTAVRSKLYNLIQFMISMQSFNGYFYNFLYTTGQINTNGSTSANTANWWSWRALQALTEAAPEIKKINVPLYNKMTTAISNLVSILKGGLVTTPQTTTTVSGITIPQWLPDGSGTDQSSVLILGLIDYCKANTDPVMVNFIKSLADGIMLMQQKDTAQFPFGAFLSWQNTWHAYGNIQAYALMQAGNFLDSPKYNTAAIKEVNNFYPWLLQNGYLSAFSISNNGTSIQILSETSYDQIAYGIEPMVFAAAEAYKETGQAKYADIAGHLAAWFLGDNVANADMYLTTTGVCYDGLSASGINQNSGAESTIEALLSLQKVQADPAIVAALNKYKKQ